MCYTDINAHMRVFIGKENNGIDFFCYISGDRKEEASPEYFAQAAAARWVSEGSSVPLLPTPDL